MQSPSSSSGKRFKNGVWQRAQAYSADRSLGFSRHLRHTGMRFSSVSGASQTRHSSGKVNEKKAAGIFRIAASAAEAGLMTLLLLKIHLRFKTLVYHSGGENLTYSCGLLHQNETLSICRETTLPLPDRSLTVAARSRLRSAPVRSRLGRAFGALRYGRGSVTPSDRSLTVAARSRLRTAPLRSRLGRAFGALRYGRGSVAPSDRCRTAAARSRLRTAAARSRLRSRDRQGVFELVVS